ncbi:MAG TPA: hypothetical protein VFS24_16845, partial [Steroidobacteraceae bacterium]|nr:hypothetical protein [Steroidobacteraceae bacterium]
MQREELLDGTNKMNRMRDSRGGPFSSDHPVNRIHPVQSLTSRLAWSQVRKKTATRSGLPRTLGSLAALWRLACRRLTLPEGLASSSDSSSSRQSCSFRQNVFSY